LVLIPTPKTRHLPRTDQAYIVVDFEVDAESVFISIRNLSDLPALRLRIKSSVAIQGLDGEKDISQLAIFKEISYFAPHKKIRVYVDEHESFFKHLTNTKVSFTIAYEDESARPVRHTIHHELAIYKDLTYYRGKP